MTGVADAAEGVALLLAVVTLWQDRPAGMPLLFAAQSFFVAVAAASHGAWVATGLEILWGVAGLPWLLRAPGWRSRRAWGLSRLDRRRAWGSSAGPPDGLAGRLPVAMRAGGLAAAMVSIAIPAVGPGLAVALISAMLTTARGTSSRLLAVAGMQNGVLLAALATGPVPVLPALPILPAAFGSGILLRRYDAVRVPTAVPFACCAALVSLAALWPWMAGPGAPPLTWASAMLVALAATLLRAPGHDRSARLGSLLMPAGSFIAIVAGTDEVRHLGLALAAAGTGALASARQVCLAVLGAGLVLFGDAALAADPAAACACALAGFGCMALAAPELAILALLLLLGLRARLSAGPMPPGPDALWLLAGLSALAVAIAGLARSPGPRQARALATVGQAGVILFALGLDTQESAFAAAIQAILLVLTRLALETSRPGGTACLAGWISLAGLPPFGLFPGLALILVASAQRAPWLLVGFAPLIAGLGWLILARLPGEAGPGQARGSQEAMAWVPLALALLLGFCMPGPAADALRDMVNAWPGLR